MANVDQSAKPQIFFQNQQINSSHLACKTAQLTDSINNSPNYYTAHTGFTL